jgi:3-oxoadipate enol-lactonase
MQIEVRGATLNVEVDGLETSPALLLWPPGSCALRVWDHIVARLADQFRIVRFDIRGLGDSTPASDPETQYTFEQYAEDACRVLDHFGIARCHVWAQSWGSRAAMVFCALNPERVMSAALFAANTGMPDTGAQQEGSKQAAQKQRAAGIQRSRPPEGWNVHQTPDAVLPAMLALRKFDLTTVVDKLTMPVLIATGDHDPNLTSSSEVAATAPDARLVVLENVGHVAILERPDLAIETFLTFQSSLD